jgi:hypothetical protein
LLSFSSFIDNIQTNICKYVSKYNGIKLKFHWVIGM